jgi:hypothetical protein
MIFDFFYQYNGTRLKAKPVPILSVFLKTVTSKKHFALDVSTCMKKGWFRESSKNSHFVSIGPVACALNSGFLPTRKPIKK